MSAELKDVKGHLSQLQTKVSDQGAMLSSEVEEAKSQLEQLQTEVSDQRTAITSELKETKHQLEQIFEAVLHVGEIVKNSTDNNRLRDCSEAPASGVYTIQPGCSGQKFKVYCDMETDGGGWTVFQRRQDGSVDFYRSFSEYSEGFGDPKGEFWLGNRKIHTLTAHSNYELRVDLTDFEGNSVYALYDSFRIGDLSDNFKLFVEGCSGTAGDSLSYHNGRPFSTKDRDNDDSNESSCAKLWQGAWWYGECYDSNLNGKYLGEADDEAGIVWHAWKPDHYSLKTTEMKMRLRS